MSMLTGFLTKAVVDVVNIRTRKTFNSDVEMPFGCCESYLVLAGGLQPWQNDRKSFLYRGYLAADTVAMTLQKDCADIKSLNNNDMGIFYPKESFTKKDVQKLYVGYDLSWNNVLTAYGEGIYRVKAVKVIAGVEEIEYSPQFELRKYSDTRADRTVYFEWEQNGNIKSNEFDYTEMKWKDYFRCSGKFGNREPEMVTDSVLYSTYLDTQIQDEIINKYTYQSELIEKFLSSLLIDNLMLADKVKVTDFNAFSHRNDFVEFEIKPDSSEIEELQLSKKAVLTLNFTDRTKNNIKTL